MPGIGKRFTRIATMLCPAIRRRVYFLSNHGSLNRSRSPPESARKSTCLHLGIGGTHKDPAVNKAHHEAMATYRRLEPSFKRGTFCGIDELAHVHIHPSQPAAVINCFNLEDRSRQRELEFVPERCGLDPSRNYKVQGVPARAAQEGYALMLACRRGDINWLRFGPAEVGPSIVQ